MTNQKSKAIVTPQTELWRVYKFRLGLERQKKKEITVKDTQEKSDSDISDTDSSISLDFDDQVVQIGNTLESTKRKQVEVESETVATKEEERPSKKFKTFDFKLID